MDGRGRWEWLAPLTGVAFVVVVVVSFILMGEPPDADDPASEIVEHYVDNKDSIEIGALLGALAGHCSSSSPRTSRRSCGGTGPGARCFRSPP